MNIKNNLESTILSAIASKKEIIDLCDEADLYEIYGICVHPAYVSLAKATLKADSNVKIITVIGFPLGQNITEVKVYETLGAVKDGATEIDMVLNIAKFKEGDIEYCINEINEVKRACNTKVLKVIVETALLTKEELVSVCEMIAKTNADYIKTSTGFSTAGAELSTIKKWKSILKGSKKIKASGGVSSFSNAVDFVNAGADTIGTSKALKIIFEEEKNNKKQTNA